MAAVRLISAACVLASLGLGWGKVLHVAIPGNVGAEGPNPAAVGGPPGLGVVPFPAAGAGYGGGYGGGFGGGFGGGYGGGFAGAGGFGGGYGGGFAGGMGYGGPMAMPAAFPVPVDRSRSFWNNAAYRSYYPYGFNGDPNTIG